MTLRKAKFIKTKKKIKANVFDLHFDEVKWVNGNKTIRDLICLLYTSDAADD